VPPDRLPGPLLARAPAAPVRSGALCAARGCFWQYVWFAAKFALEAPFRVQHLLPWLALAPLFLWETPSQTSGRSPQKAVHSCSCSWPPRSRS
jgi:hypothetical protein